MKLNIKKSNIFKIGAVLLIGLIIFVVSNPNTNLFKGAVGDATGTVCEADQASYEELYQETVDDLEEVELLNTENPTLEGYTDRETLIETIKAFLEANAIYDCKADMTEIIAQLSSYQSDEIANMNLDLKTAIDSMPTCPLDNKQHVDFQLFTDFLDAHKAIQSGVSSLNTKNTWGASDYELLKKLVISMRGLDLYDLRVNLTDKEIASIEANLSDLNIDFANNTIQAYNSEVIGAALDLECNGFEVLPMISPPLECENGTVYSESSQVCVATKSVAKSTSTCEYNELYEDIDSVYDLLKSAEANPSSFTDGQSATLASLLSEFPTDLENDVVGYILDFDYLDDANDLIDELNIIILDTEDSNCDKDLLGYLDLYQTNAPQETNNDNKEEYECPAGATYALINNVDICTCDADASIVEPGGTCEQPNNTVATNQDEDEEEGQNEEQEEEEQAELFVCLDGETEVEDPFDCPGFDEEVIPETNNTVETVDPVENEIPAYYSVAETVEVNQSNNIDLTTNTNPSIMTSPEVQGDTGPGAITAFLVFLSVLGGGLLKSLSLI